MEYYAINSKVGLLPDQTACKVKCEHFRCRSGKDGDVTIKLIEVTGVV